MYMHYDGRFYAHIHLGLICYCSMALLNPPTNTGKIRPTCTCKCTCEGVRGVGVSE